MPLKVSSLQPSETKTVTFEWQGEEETPDSVTVTYRDVTTPLYYQLLSQRIAIGATVAKGGNVQLKDAANVTEALALVLSGMIVEWDVLGEDGGMYPATFDALAMLPMGFLFTVFDTISTGQADPNASKTGRRSRGG